MYAFSWLPFPVVALPAFPPVIEEMSENQFDEELDKGYQDFLAGRAKPANNFFDDMERKFSR